MRPRSIGRVTRSASRNVYCHCSNCEFHLPWHIQRHRRSSNWRLHSGQFVGPEKFPSQSRRHRREIRLENKRGRNHIMPRSFLGGGPPGLRRTPRPPGRSTERALISQPKLVWGPAARVGGTPPSTRSAKNYVALNRQHARVLPTGCSEPHLRTIEKEGAEHGSEFQGMPRRAVSPGKGGERSGASPLGGREDEDCRGTAYGAGRCFQTGTARIWRFARFFPTVAR